MNVQWNAQKSRFELETGGQMAIADCLTGENEWAVTHVEVPPSLRGGGVASALAAGIVEYAREKGGKIAPVCPFMVAYFARHPDIKDVLSDGYEMD